MASSHHDGAKALVNGAAAASLVPSKRKATPAAEADASVAKRAAAASGKVLLTGDIDRDVAVKKAAECSYLKSKASATISATAYPDVWGIRDAYKVFNLEDGGLSAEALDRAHSIVRAHIDKQTSRQLGYQCNLHINASKYASHYLDTCVRP